MMKSIIITQKEMELFIAPEATSDPNILHRTEWRRVPYANQFFKAAPVPGLMGASLLELLLQKEVLTAKDQRINSMFALFSAPLYAGQEYHYEFEAKNESMIKAAIKDQDKNCFSMRFGITKEELPEQISEEEAKNDFTYVILSAQRLDAYLKSIKCEKYEPSQFPRLFIVAATASQAMFQKFRDEVQGKVYATFSAKFFRGADDLKTTKRIICYVSDSAFDQKRGIYTINLTASTADYRKIYTAETKLVSLQQLAENKPKT